MKIKNQEDLKTWYSTMIHHPAHQDIADELLLLRALTAQRHNHKGDIEDMREGIVRDIDESDIPERIKGRMIEHSNCMTDDELLEKAFGPSKECSHDQDLTSQISTILAHCNKLIDQ